MKKLLVLGGKPIGSCELVKRAKELGYYVVVTDYLKDSPAKKIADEAWDVSTADITSLARLCHENLIDGISTAVHEFNINRMIDLCELLEKPCYCNRKTWIYCDNKLKFKELCKNNHIPVAKEYSYNDIKNIKKDNFPTIIIKPIDGSGSRGFKTCHNIEEFMNSYKYAMEYSPSKQVLIEEYIPFDSVIIHYTMVQGKCFFSGMSDKYSAKFSSTGAPVMGLQIFPSKGKDIYMQILNDKVCKMFEQAGFINGPIWIEAFYDGNKSFIFNEMGYRFGGSLTYYPVKYFYNFSQLDLLIQTAFSKRFIYDLNISSVERSLNKKYCILPIHIKPGIINKIEGVKDIMQYENIYSFVPVHFLGDEIKEWGSAQQVFCYIHILYDSSEYLKKIIEIIMQKLTVTDVEGNSMLYTLFDLNNISQIC